MNKELILEKVSNYDLVKWVIESYEDEDILNDFLNEFKVGKNISRMKYINFCMRYMSDSSDLYNIKISWKYIKSGGDESWLDEMQA
jgi:hypothetical protein